MSYIVWAMHERAGGWFSVGGAPTREGAEEIRAESENERQDCTHTIRADDNPPWEPKVPRDDDG